jgi:hypothetical protein
VRSRDAEIDPRFVQAPDRRRDRPARLALGVRQHRDGDQGTERQPVHLQRHSRQRVRPQVDGGADHLLGRRGAGVQPGERRYDRPDASHGGVAVDLDLEPRPCDRSGRRDVPRRASGARRPRGLLAAAGKHRPRDQLSRQQVVSGRAAHRNGVRALSRRRQIQPHLAWPLPRQQRGAGVQELAHRSVRQPARRRIPLGRGLRLLDRPVMRDPLLDRRPT